MGKAEIGENVSAALFESDWLCRHVSFAFLGEDVRPRLSADE
jgi:hypothetical protein